MVQQDPQVDGPQVLEHEQVPQAQRQEGRGLRVRVREEPGQVLQGPGLRRCDMWTHTHARDQTGGRHHLHERR